MKKDWIVVIASIRNINHDYLSVIPDDIPIVVVDDSNGNIKKSHHNVTVINYKDQEDYLGEYVDLIPRKTPSCKNFGLIYAYREGYQRVIGLDDDVDLRVSPDFMSDADIIGKEAELPYVSSENGWFNPCSMLKNGKQYSRGYPYELRGVRENYKYENEKKKVVFNAGLWTGTPDINGIDKLNREVFTENELKEPQRVGVAKNTVFPLSIMNYQILTECIPAFYQPPDFDMTDGFRVRRHDDVWSALILKYLADKKGDGMTVGKPIVDHTKSGDINAEILSEHFTNLIHHDFCNVIQEATNRVMPSSYLDMYRQTALNIVEIASKKVRGIYDEVFLALAEKMLRWGEIFK
ncbi:MAG: hypothetical protein MUP16_12210 [Sedimentisphaerales bacterium]|nr:hypothetical protein [Sedimentisphaerales bacterium]